MQSLSIDRSTKTPKHEKSFINRHSKCVFASGTAMSHFFFSPPYIILKFRFLLRSSKSWAFLKKKYFSRALKKNRTFSHFCVSAFFPLIFRARAFALELKNVINYETKNNNSLPTSMKWEYFLQMTTIFLPAPSSGRFARTRPPPFCLKIVTLLMTNYDENRRKKLQNCEKLML